MRSSHLKPQNGSNYSYTKLKASGQQKADSAGSAMPQKPQKNAQTAHYIELGGYQYWPVLVPRGIRLYTYEQIPVFMRENPYITDGYRAYLPSRLCIKSLFILSNETVNIWSHLLGFLLFFCLGVYNMASLLPAIGASREDYVIYSVGLFCFQLCMLCSVGYHLFCCHRSEKTSRRWMALDYTGVSIGILGCYVPGVFYTFYCNNYLRQVYLVTVLAMILAVFFAQIHPLYLSKQWKQLRSLIFCSVAGYGLVPTVHWICITGGFSSELVQAFVPRVLGMYFIAALALVFYVSKVPERYFPGQLNYLGSSHQVWHLLLVLMFYWWHQTSGFIMAYRHSQPCPEASQHS
uniref:Progestin and adipoQ receptor family member IIIa n=2 Tax=Nothobranchius pienaari TaxID=704102 RepID=A0A1A8RBK3_9TELE